MARRRSCRFPLPTGDIGRLVAPDYLGGAWVAHSDVEVAQRTFRPHQ